MDSVIILTLRSVDNASRVGGKGQETDILSPSLSFNKLISPECPKFIKGHTLTKISENEFPDFEVGTSSRLVLKFGIYNQRYVTQWEVIAGWVKAIYLFAKNRETSLSS